MLLGLVLFGMWWTRTHDTVSAAGSPVQAELVDANALSASMRRALQRVPSRSRRAPPPAEAARRRRKPIPEPARRKRRRRNRPRRRNACPCPTRIEQDARRPRRDRPPKPREREQEEKRRQEQIDLTERQRQAEAESTQRLAQMERSACSSSTDRSAKQRARRRSEADLAEQKLKQIADAQSRNAAEAAAQADADASPPAGNNGADADLRRVTAAALQEAILRNWTRPDSVPRGPALQARHPPVAGRRGHRRRRSRASCPYDELGKRSVEAAVLKAQPLPYAGFETVFSRNLTVNFEAQDR